MFEAAFPIEFGDCDPAGIVFYPAFFRWFDATFQRWLRDKGADQALIRDRFDAVGTGLIEAGASFRAPVRPGDLLSLAIAEVVWEERTLRVSYRGTVAGRTAVEGHEVRGLFALRTDGTLRLVPLGDLRAMLSA